MLREIISTSDNGFEFRNNLIENLETIFTVMAMAKKIKRQPAKFLAYFFTPNAVLFKTSVFNLPALS